MNSLFFKIILLFIWIDQIRPQDQCLVQTEKPAPKWKLIWEDNFDSAQIDPNKWTIADAHDDSQFCDSFLDCLSKHNVRAQNGFLLVTSKFYEFENYTSSKLTSGKILGPGRLEIRARLPQDATSVTRIQASLDSSQESYINVLVNYLETYQSYQMQSKLEKFEILDLLNLGENGFHIFGFEWTYEWVRFFFNGKSTREMSFGKDLAAQMRSKNSKLQLTFEVSYPTRRMHLFQGETTQILKSKPPTCSALIVDYVKVFQKLDPEEISQLPECVDVRNEKAEVAWNLLDNKTCELREEFESGNRNPKFLDLSKESMKVIPKPEFTTKEPKSENLKLIGEKPVTEQEIEINNSQKPKAKKSGSKNSKSGMHQTSKFILFSTCLFLLGYSLDFAF